MGSMRDPKNILITGASSGLGAALAKAYASPGRILFLQGRNSERLNAAAEDARNLGAEVFTKIIDITNATGLLEWIINCDASYPLDLVIANAGISASTSTIDDGAEIIKAIFDVNLFGVLNTVHPAIPLMKSRQRGQIAIMSSLAGFRGFPKSSAYCASKAAVRIYGEAIRPELAINNVELNVICPGFVKTPMTDVNDFPMPFLMSPERAAQIIKNGLEKNKARIVFPWQMYLLVKLISALPSWLVDSFAVKNPGKYSCRCCKK